MAEQVGTTTEFDMAVDEILEYVFESFGGEHISHKEARLARTSLNLLFIDMQNRGMAPLASMELSEVALVSGSSQGYQMESDVVNILDAVVEVSNASNSTTDLPIQRISYVEWLDLPTKQTSKGRPTQFMVDNQRGAPKINVWPVPERNNYKIKAWTLKRVKDVTKSFQLVGLSHIYLPAIIAGMKYYTANLNPKTSLDEKVLLKQEYDMALQLALEEDRERVDIQIYPADRNPLR